MTKVVIAGSRSVTDYTLVKRHRDALPYAVTEVVSGTARGADTLGERWAKERGIPVKRMPARWGVFGKSAGYIRNKEMAKYVSEHGGKVVVFWDGVSRGSASMIDLAKQHGITPEIFDALPSPTPKGGA